MSTRALLRIATLLSDYTFRPFLEKTAHRLALGTQLPSHFVQLLLAVEDKRFAYHVGVDPIAIVRAFAHNVGTAVTRPHGASTITQQIYSNLSRMTGEYQPTLAFKILQVAWALRKTATTPKQDVLEDYLDKIYFGGSIYGLEQAAWIYCNRSPKELSIADSFFLVERIARPNSVSIHRISMLASRIPIAALLNSDPMTIRNLESLYDKHFHCGKVISACLEKSIKK